MYHFPPSTFYDFTFSFRKKGFGGTAGMAFVGTVCSRSHAGGINVVCCFLIKYSSGYRHYDSLQHLLALFFSLRSLLQQLDVMKDIVCVACVLFPQRLCWFFSIYYVLLSILACFYVAVIITMTKSIVEKERVYLTCTSGHGLSLRGCRLRTRSRSLKQKLHRNDGCWLSLAHAQTSYTAQDHLLRGPNCPQWLDPHRCIDKDVSQTCVIQVVLQL